MTPSQSSAKCRKDKIARGYKRIPDLISPVAADDLDALMKRWNVTKTKAIEMALASTRYYYTLV